MDNNLIKKYKDEMLRIYRTSATIAPVNTTADTNKGYLIGIVTAVRSLYPVKNAKITIFTGDYENMNVIDSDLTDQSGRTKTFVLPTPESSISLDQNNTAIPYSLYNMAVEADGYIKNIHLNIPVFGTVTSLQQSNLLLEETAGEDKGPQIFDETQNYDL